MSRRPRNRQSDIAGHASSPRTTPTIAGPLFSTPLPPADYDICANNHGGDSASEAANPTPATKAEWQERVYQWICRHGVAGGTADECAAHFDVDHNTVAPRFTELRKVLKKITYKFDLKGEVVLRTTRGGKGAKVHVKVVV
jgi:hypothetical protein